jgi:hypothetical protein
MQGLCDFSKRGTVADGVKLTEAFFLKCNRCLRRLYENGESEQLSLFLSEYQLFIKKTKQIRQNSTKSLTNGRV